MEDIIELPTDLMKEAVDCVVPYLAVSKDDRSNSIKTFDYSRKFIEALVEEIKEGEPFCDHSVGICACGALAILNELQLRLKGMKTCPTCYGDGFEYVEAITRNNYGHDSDMIECRECEGTGAVKA